MEAGQNTEELATLFGMGLGGGVVFCLCYALTLIAWSVVWIFIMAGIYHILLMLFDAANRDYEATFRGVTYPMGMLQVLSIPCLFIAFMPCIGCIGSLLMFALGIWGIVITVIALKEIHRTDYWRVICAYLLPMILCCGCMIAITAAFVIPALVSGGGFSELFEQIRNAAEQAGGE